MSLAFVSLPGSAGLLLLIAIAVAPVQSPASSSGPPNERTGAPGELTCTQCHTSFPLNSGSGALSLVGAPAVYQAGQTYRLTVSLADPAANRWGFELTALDAANGAAGDLVSIGTLTQTSTAPNGREYLKHTTSGTALGTTGSRQWGFDWTAPASGTGPVTFWFAGNAANGDFSNAGDRIYNANFTLAEDDVTAAPAVLGSARLLPSVPNPFNPRTELRFEIDRATAVRLVVVDARGRHLRELSSGWRDAGVHAVVWDGRDDQGGELASGTFFVRLITADQVEAQAITLIR